LAELPDVGWKLLVSLLPESHSVSSGSHRPVWRSTIPDDWDKGVTYQEYWQQIALYSELAINAAKKSREKLVELVEHLENLPPTAHEQLLAYLGSNAIVSLPEAERLDLWTALIDLTTKHRKFSDAAWALKPEQVDKIASVAARVAPNSPGFRYQRLFSERDFDLYEEKGTFEEQRKELENRRERAIREIAATGGTKAVLVFATSVQSPWRAGLAFGVVANEDVDSVVLPDLLESDQKALAQFSGGFIWSRFQKGSWRWVDSIETSGWTFTQIGQFLSFLPFSSETWERSRRLLKDDESAYWTKTSANPYEASTELEGAIDHLVQYGRPYAAIRSYQSLLHHKQPFDSGRAIRVLLAALKSSESTHSINAYEIVEIIKALQNDPNTSADDLFRVEWAYLPLFQQHRDASPKLLERRLSGDPGFFCEVIRLVFRSKKEESLTVKPSEETKNIATNAYRLLSEWRTPPGYREDGTFSGEILATWLDTVKKECADTGHLEIAMTMVGHALIHVPPDSDGLWINRSAAATLNAKDAEDMRNGFRTELYNSRGAHWVDPTGKPEKELAEKYRAQAEAVEGAGYHRLAVTLRELAGSYEREAQAVSSRDSFGE